MAPMISPQRPLNHVVYVAGVASFEFWVLSFELWNGCAMEFDWIRGKQAGRKRFKNVLHLSAALIK